jgi:type II secretory pathway component PulF
MTPGASVGGLYLGGLVSTLGIATVVVGFVFSFPMLIAALDVEAQWDRFLRSVPLVSAPMRKLAASRFVLGLGLANASGLETVRALRLSVKATSSAWLEQQLPQLEAKLRGGATLTESVRTLGLLDAGELGTLAVAETTGTLDETLTRLSRELQEQSLRAMRFLVLFVTALIAVVLLVKILGGMLGVLLGPVKSLYDAAGSGKLDG